MAWTEDRVAILTKLWADGLSASQIAKELGEVTRNAVIGKVHRLGLSGRAAAAAVPAPPPLEAKPMSNGEFATILTITDHMCKWPIGDPSKSEFRFCGRKTDPDLRKGAFFNGSNRMADSNSNKGLYFIVGALVVAVLGLGTLYLTGQSADEPTLSIDVGEDGIDIDTND